MLLGIHPENPNQHEIEKVIQSLKQGGGHYISNRYHLCNWL